MQHPNHKLVGYLEGSLPDKERAEVESHLASCPACRSELHTLDAAGQALQAAASSVARPEFDPAMWSRVREQIAPAARPRPFSRRWVAASGGLAATALAVFLIYVNGGRFQVPEPDSAPADGPAVVNAPKASPFMERGRESATVKAKSAPKGGSPAASSPQTLSPAPGIGATEGTVGSGTIGGAVQPLPESGDIVAGVNPTPTPPSLSFGGGAPVPGGAGGAVTDSFVRTPGLPSAPVAIAAPSTTGRAATHDRVAATGSPKASAPETAGFADAAKPEAPGPRLAGRATANETVEALQPRRGDSVPDGALQYRMEPGGAQGFAPKAQRWLAQADLARKNNQRPAEAAYLNNAINSGLTGEDLRATHIRLGDVFLQQGDATRALVEFRRANEVRPGTDSLNRIAVACERTGDPNGARKAYEQALQLDANNAEAKAGLARVKSAG